MRLKNFLARKLGRGAPLLILSLLMLPVSAQDQTSEEQTNYYLKWLEEDVVYLISPAEREVFLKLNTPHEKDVFIEQFWQRRDPTPETAENEFKLEHYRRIAFVNERYFSGVPGWKSDRGKMYIKYGPPDSIERQPYGGPYRRSAAEGGGETTAFPFEKWWYEHIEGVGTDVEIEFVDRNFSNEYRLALNPNEKDAFLHVPGHGSTQLELDGLQSRFDRISTPLGIDRSNPHVRRGDLPFVRLRRWSQLQQAPVVKHTRLQEIVTADIRFDQLPFEFQSSWLRLGEDAVVPLSFAFAHANLQFGDDGLGGDARVNLLGRVKGLNGQILAVFEDEIVATRSDPDEVRRGKSIYQRMVVLPPGRYRLDVVAEDAGSGKIGTLQQGLIVPSVKREQLTASPMVLVERVEPREEIPSSNDPPEMFVFGTLRIIPRIGIELPERRYLVFYYELYNVAADSASGRPDLSLTYRVLEGERVTVEKVDEGAARATYQSEQRVAFLEYLNLKGTQAQSLVLEVEAYDRIADQTLTFRQPVRISADQ